jgi:hypothetical protein
MTQPPSFREALISQIPALRLLMGMGWTYLSPSEAPAARRVFLAEATSRRISAQPGWRPLPGYVTHVITSPVVGGDYSYNCQVYI